MTSVIHGYCTLCRSRCGTLNTVDGDQLISVEPDPSHPTEFSDRGTPAHEAGALLQEALANQLRRRFPNLRRADGDSRSCPCLSLTHI